MLCVLVVAAHGWTRIRLSKCPPYASAAIMHSSAKKAQAAVERSKKVHDAVKICVHMIARDEAPPKLADLVKDLYFVYTTIYKELMEVLESGNWTYTSTESRGELWELFSGVCHTKSVLEDMFGRLKHITTSQNRNTRINLHRIATECMDAATLADDSSGKMLSLTDEDWAQPLDVANNDISDGIFYSEDHKLENPLEAPRAPYELNYSFPRGQRVWKCYFEGIPINVRRV